MDDHSLENSEKAIAVRVSGISIVVNLALSVFKLLAGILAHSGAMISDAIHSASDVFSTVIVVIGVMAANKKADREHPYGHERFECVASFVLALVLLGAGVKTGMDGIGKIRNINEVPLVMPGLLALVAAAVSIITKEWMYWYTKLAAEKIRSGALMADAWHHRSDALSSIGALIGIFGARMGFAIGDALASIVISIFIMVAACKIIKDALDRMIDKSCDEQMEERMRRLIAAQEGVLGITLLQTRLFGSKVYVDVEIEADGKLRLYESHRIAHDVHDVIEDEFPEVKHCMVHVNPKQSDDS